MSANCTCSRGGNAATCECRDVPVASMGTDAVTELDELQRAGCVTAPGISYTPGPWTIELTTIVDENGTAICELGDMSGHDGPTWKANARLIAAAPDLLAKVEEFAGSCAECNGTGLRTIYNYDGHGSDADDQPCPDCEDIRAVIAKAVQS